ncbi:hypothetical protein FHR32_006139 [Streptosporangium album]|uniref:Uncharacterized protein n=1 Tax=Streptosporangium album TaxID=47479 RepID=A0A7W7S122_9ACTN|nr:hypothetical protein [Streptosporangium album]MBB4941762.1 hypothetical protein [Streptosporangium album]
MTDRNDDRPGPTHATGVPATDGSLFDHDTEQLRTALRDYRAMLEQLLDPSNGTR